MTRNRGALLCALFAVACGGNAQGGGSGGSAGAGGTATGGSGGVGTGGAAGSGGDITAKIDALCQQVDALPCALADCKAQVTESVAEAEFAKCTLELREALQCVLAQGMICDGGDPVAPPACKPLMSALESCLPSCGGGGSGMSCSGSCVGKYVNWAAECQVTAGSMVCTCTIGSGAGKQFSVAGTCSDNWEPQAQAQCN